jgi:hypothetical protein
MFTMKYPDGYLWEFPGFYSLTVPYGKTNDFFYSGHVGICLINSLEFNANKWFIMSKISFLMMILQGFLMIVARGHYSIDLLAGIVFAHYFWVMAERLSYLVDVKLLKMPLVKRFPTITNVCNKC